MYSDSTRTGHYRLIHQNTDDYCYCLHCVQYGPSLYQGGPGGYTPPPTHPNHPELDLRRDFSLPPFPVEPEDIGPGLEKCEGGGEGRGDGGGGEGGEGEGEGEGRGAKAGAGWGVSGHSAPQRRPVFTGPGQYGQPQPGQFNPSHPWNYNPAQWSCPAEPGLGLRFYSPVKEQCGYVGQGGGGAAGTGIGTHPFNSSRNASASSLPPDPAHTQFRGQRTKHRQASYSYGPEKQIWDQSKYRLERQASYSSQEQHRQASLGSEKQVWGQSKHRLERQNSFSPQEIHNQASYIYSPEDKLTHRQSSYGPEQQVWGQLKHRQTSYSYSPEEQVWGCVGDEHDHLDRCVPLDQGDLHPHMPNGHSGGGGPSPRHVYSQGVGDITNYQERTNRLKAGGAVGGAGVDSCNGRHVPAGSVQKTFFSTEVPQKQLVSQPRQRSPCGPGLGHRTPSHGATGPVHGATIGREERFNQRAKQPASQWVNQNQGGDPDSDPQRQRGKQKEGQGSVRENQGLVWENQCPVRENQGSVRQKEGSVREQIRQVVSDLEGVLGGLKQVHVEMKEVVQQIDLLTANIDLEEEEGSCNSSPHGGDALPNPRDCRGVLMYNQKTSTGEQMYTHKIRTVDLKTNGDQGLLYRDHDHTVIIQTTSPSHVLTASVIKTNQVGVTALSPLSPSPSKDSEQERRGLNKDPPIPDPSRDINHVTQTPGIEQIPSLPLPLRTHTPIPTAMVGYSVPSRRSQKPPLYPHPNGRVERLNKGLAPPPYLVHSALPVLPHLAQPPYPTHPNHPALPPSALKTPPYMEKSRPSSSMV